MIGRARRRARGALVAATATVGLCGASCSTVDIVKGFNNGAHGTQGNPAESFETAGARIVAALIRDRMTGSYFHQGARGAASSHHPLDQWTEYAKGSFVGHVQKAVGGAHPSSRVDVDSLGYRKLAETELADGPWNQLSRSFPPCDGTGALSRPARTFVDGVRFQAAYLQAVATASDWYGHGFITLRALERGANLGFDEARTYLANRKWNRDPVEPTTGLVISGGASTGMYSAGAVWIMLHMIQGCLNSPHCPGGDHRFRLVSGTSAGALIATAVDLFNSEIAEGVQHKRPGVAGTTQAPALQMLAGWFTCLPANQLYCVEKDTSASLFTSRVGIARFDGVRYLLGKTVTPSMIDNVSELILNTVDFQTGELLALSDQNPFETKDHCDVVNQALASIPLPLIANPQPALRVQGAVRSGFYLDGGVRSTLPLFPVVARGAERVVVVSSSAPLLDGSTPPGDALNLLSRYTGIASGQSSEEGVAFSKTFAALRHARELALCSDPPQQRDPGDPQPAWWGSLCKGDFAAVCPAPATPGAPAASPPESPIFAELYRDEARVDEASGYNFKPRESLVLFLAGMAAARERCAELAAFLGMHDTPEAVQRWCNAPMPTRKLCESPAFARTFDVSSDDAPRVCNDKDRDLSYSWGCP